MRKYDYYWASKREWYEFNKFGDRVIRSDAPPEAQESWKKYREQKERAQIEMKKFGYAD